MLRGGAAKRTFGRDGDGESEDGGDGGGGEGSLRLHLQHGGVRDEREMVVERAVKGDGKEWW